MNADGTGAARPATRVDTNTTLDWGRQGTLLPPPQPGTVPPPVSAPASPPEPEAVARPALGESFQARVLSGEVLVSVPSGTARASQSVPGLKGRRFVPLGRLRTLPSGDFSAGVFQVLQSRRRAAKGLTELRLNGFSFRSCGRGQGSGASARSSRVSRRTIRSLRAKANGRFRTRGRYSAATVRGTEWVTTDRCDGTLTKVTRGRVAVRDFCRKKTVLVRAGKSYLASGRR